MMKTFSVVTEERVGRSYTVRAESADAAREKFERGEYDVENPGEALDCEVIDVVEIER